MDASYLREAVVLANKCYENLIAEDHATRWTLGPYRRKALADLDVRFRMWLNNATLIYEIASGDGDDAELNALKKHIEEAQWVPKMTPELAKLRDQAIEEYRATAQPEHTCRRSDRPRSSR